jgi:hypothetical protein
MAALLEQTRDFSLEPTVSKCSAVLITAPSVMRRNAEEISPGRRWCRTLA